MKTEMSTKDKKIEKLLKICDKIIADDCVNNAPWLSELSKAVGAVRGDQSQEKPDE